MAKIGWLVWRFGDEDYPEFWKTEPDWCARKARIVYFEIEEDS